MLPLGTKRPRTGVNRLSRWPAIDPILLPSCLCDFSYLYGVYGSDGVTPTVDNGQVFFWRNRVDGQVATWSTAKPVLHSTTGITNGVNGMVIMASTMTLTGAFTAYWLANYAGVSGLPFGGNGANYRLQALPTVGYFIDPAGNVSADFGTSGAKLYRWRRTSAGACYVKATGIAEASAGTRLTTLILSCLFAANGVAAEGTDNLTRRIVMYNDDLVTTGQSTAVEAAINATP